MGNNQTSTNVELTQENLAMLARQTNLSTAKVAEWFEDFKSECKNGELDKKSFVRFYRELLPHKKDSEKFCEFAFNGKQVPVSCQVFAAVYHIRF